MSPEPEDSDDADSRSQRSDWWKELRHIFLLIDSNGQIIYFIKEFIKINSPRVYFPVAKLKSIEQCYFIALMHSNSILMFIA